LWAHAGCPNAAQPESVSVSPFLRPKGRHGKRAVDPEPDLPIIWGCYGGIKVQRAGLGPARLVFFAGSAGSLAAVFDAAVAEGVDASGRSARIGRVGVGALLLGRENAKWCARLAERSRGRRRGRGRSRGA